MGDRSPPRFRAQRADGGETTDGKAGRARASKDILCHAGDSGLDLTWKDSSAYSVESELEDRLGRGWGKRADLGWPGRSPRQRKMDQSDDADRDSKRGMVADMKGRRENKGQE